MQQPSLVSGASFDNDELEHRQALIAALSERGIEAYGYSSGGGLEHVCVYLVEEQEEWLAIATGSADTPCDIGLIVERDGVDITLTPEIHELGTVQTPDTPYRVLIKVPVRPVADEQADLKAFAEALRARYGKQKGGL